MYTVKSTSKFQKDLKRADKRGYRIELLTTVIKKLAAGEVLDTIYNDHPLKGQYKGCRECHITPDWLLIYEIIDCTLILYLTRTGTHADLYS
jgi:mRNA interferase YafQ